MTTDMPYKPYNYTLHPMSMSDLGFTHKSRHRTLAHGADQGGVLK